MSHPPARTDIACRNCGTPAPQNFCAACGQETALHPPTLGEFLHEFIGHYVALEGALWRSLGMLLLRPGRLTREYLEGRRRRYVLPLRLYLSASFLFFLVLKLLPSAVDQAVVLDPADLPASAAVVVAVGASAPASSATAPASAPATSISGPVAASGVIVHPAGVLRPIDCGAAGEPACHPMERFANRIGERFSSDPQGVVKSLLSRLVGVAPYAVFLLLPVFSGLVAFAYRSRGMTYGEHVVFSLHLHAFWFLALLPITLFAGAVGDALMWVVPIYGVLALREVYRGTWWATLLRAGMISVAYFVVLLLATTTLVVALLAMA